MDFVVVHVLRAMLVRACACLVPAQQISSPMDAGAE